MPSPQSDPRVTAILETALYVDDLGRSICFYETVFGFPRLFADERMCAFDVAGCQVLLLFRRGASNQPSVLPGGAIPPHDAEGAIHFAFAIPPEELEAWRARLKECAVSVESEVRWHRGGVSVYFRDPDGHLGELATPGLWATY